MMGSDGSDTVVGVGCQSGDDGVAQGGFCEMADGENVGFTVAEFFDLFVGGTQKIGRRMVELLVQGKGLWVGETAAVRFSKMWIVPRGRNCGGEYMGVVAR